MNECEKYQEMISALLDGELDAAQHEQLIAHMSSCAQCRELYELLSAVSGPSVWELPEVPEGLHEHIMSGVKSAAAGGKKQGSVRQLRPWLVTAACLVVIVGVVLGVPRVFRAGSSDSGSPSMFNATAAANSSAPADTAADTAAPESAPAAADNNSPAEADDDSVYGAESPAPADDGSGSAFSGNKTTDTAPAPEPEPEEAGVEDEEVPTLDIDVTGSTVTVEGSGENVSEKLSRDDTFIWLNAVIEGSAGRNITAARIEIYRLEGADYEVYIYHEGAKLMGSLSEDLTNGVELSRLADFGVFEEMADSVK